MNKVRTKIYCSPHRGVALLTVLFIVMAVTVISLTFLSQSNIELACGENIAVRAQTDYLAESGLEHARGLILNPQDVNSEYWTGENGLQLIAGSNDYYDIIVTKLGELNYQVTSNAYRLDDSEKIGQSNLTAQLRLDPCIVYWQGKNEKIQAEVSITGDIYCAEGLEIYGNIIGDVFCAGNLTNFGTVVGRENTLVTTAPQNPPNLTYTDFSSIYYYNGSGPYTVEQLPDGATTSIPEPGMNNPGRVYYCDGNLHLDGVSVSMTGTLVLKGDLGIKNGANLSITPVKNFPALIVGDQIKMEHVNGSLNVTGLVLVYDDIDMKKKIGSSLNVNGALYILDNGIKNTLNTNVTITASPDKAAIEIWSGPTTSQRWSPAAGAFYKSIQRQ